jgi:putative pyruvate formate lyase activating enzyme
MAPRTPEPGYLQLLATGELGERASLAYDLLESCTVCPRRCGVNRREDKRGFCRTGLLPVISSYGPHFGEEPPLVGRGGSGTIFVTHCNLSCEFCQNYEISRCGKGQGIPPERLAEMMIRLQRGGCHNINIVTPSHIVPQLIRSVAIAAECGLSIPLVYNSGGYDSVGSLRLLDGIIDIYMPDAKYGSNEIAEALSHAPGYVDVMKAAIREMHRQVGDLVIVDGIAVRGLIVRHLVLSENLAGSDRILPWLAEEISRDTYVNVMDQYRWPPSVAPPACITEKPAYRALLRPVTGKEYADAIRWADRAGLYRHPRSWPGASRESP